MFSCFPGVQSPINPSPDLTSLDDVLGALEGQRLEEDELICVLATLPDSREFLVQRLNKAVLDSPARHVVPPRGHHRQVSTSYLPLLVVLYPPLR